MLAAELARERLRGLASPFLGRSRTVADRLSDQRLRRTTGLARSTLCILGARQDVRCTRLHNLAGRGHHGNLRARRALHAGVGRSRQHVVVRIVGDKRPTGVLYAFNQLRHRKPDDHEPGQDYPDHDDARHRLPEQADSNPCDAGAQIAASRGELVRQEQPVDGIGRGFGREEGQQGERGDEDHHKAHSHAHRYAFAVETREEAGSDDQQEERQKIGA